MDERDRAARLTRATTQRSRRAVQTRDVNCPLNFPVDFITGGVLGREMNVKCLNLTFPYLGRTTAVNLLYQALPNSWHPQGTRRCATGSRSIGRCQLVPFQL